MKLSFEYSKEKDIWCLLNKGKSSINQPFPTDIYKKLIAQVGENPTEESTSLFIDQYLTENAIDTGFFIPQTTKEFELIAQPFHDIAEKIFQAKLPHDITVFLTVNTRCPYSIQENWFFVSLSRKHPLQTIMHELWHFYTWYKFGMTEEATIGAKKYNEIKEALTVLLNVTCRDLFPEGVSDKGYVQHQELRTKILELWNKNPDIDYVWKEALKSM